MKTKSGKHIIFHINQNPFAKPGAKLPMEWLEEAVNHGEWFFISEDGNRTAIGDMCGYPLIYSQGYQTAEEALAAAEQWEIERSLRVAFNLDAIKSFSPLKGKELHHMINATISNTKGPLRIVASVCPNVGDTLNVKGWGQCEVLKLYNTDQDNFIQVKWADDSEVLPQERNNGCPFRFGAVIW